VQGPWGEGRAHGTVAALPIMTFYCCIFDTPSAELVTVPSALL
jgi:hypothetical protein